MARTTLEIDFDKNGKFIWRLKAGNGEVIGDSSEPSASHSVILKAAKRIVSAKILIKDLTKGKTFTPPPVEEPLPETPPA